VLEEALGDEVKECRVEGLKKELREIDSILERIDIDRIVRCIRECREER